MISLTTEWGEKLDPEHVLPDYPRPQMVRDAGPSSFINLNGYWDYCITSGTDFPPAWAGKILVPFAPEAPLSGVGKVIHPGDVLWYRRMLLTPSDFVPGKNRLILNFGAVDQVARIYINRELVGEHTGGYLPFSLDISEYLSPLENELILSVQDSTDEGFWALGKQRLQPGGMYYTSVSGIWQTVWAELVPEAYITDIFLTPCCSRSAVEVEIHSSGFVTGFGEVEFTVFEGDRRVCSLTFAYHDKGTLWIPNFRPWSPEDPFLYRYELSFGEDHITGYFAMRSISIQNDSEGIPRICLNGKPYFQNGLLDQGYWPDGLYTAPSDEAMIYDIQTVKDMGFNMLRKHAKIEPLRWYYHCDRLGMLVWQDIVNGGDTPDSKYVTVLPTIFPWRQSSTYDTDNSKLGRTRPGSKEAYLLELKGTMHLLNNSPCVVLWTLFNEGWGQFDAAEMAKRARELDPTRLIDHASGWFDQNAGDVTSIHNYFRRLRVPYSTRPVVLSEFGGYSLPTPGHMCCEKVYGYRKYKDSAKFTAAYAKLMERKLQPLLRKGLCAAVYTQVSDIENEVNGLLTYDRKINKIDKDTVHKINMNISYDSQ